LFPGKIPAPSDSPLLRSVRAGKIRQLAKRLPSTALSILDTSSVARGTSSTS